MTINKTRNADPQRLKSQKLKIVKARPMDTGEARYSAFREVIIPERTAYKFKQHDVFDIGKQSNKGKQSKKNNKKGMKK
tara:strand:+ start:65 stop:301 length:237 start_codon:yes stop_codon:yes gene_type:complete